MTGKQPRVYQPGGSVKVLLPPQQNPLVARCMGPDRVRKRVGEATGVIDTPGGRGGTKMRYANMLKKRDDGDVKSMPVYAIVGIEKDSDEKRQWEKEIERKWTLEAELTSKQVLLQSGIKFGHSRERDRIQIKWPFG